MKRTELIIIAILTVLVALIPFICNIYYVTPDDPRYIALVSGAYTGTPQKELIYIGSIYGALLAFLYDTIEGHEWYSIFYYFLSLICFLTLLQRIIICSLSRSIKWSLVLLLFSAQCYLSLKPQFTMLATQISFTSLICMSIGIEAKRKSIVLLGFSVILFFIATQIRLAAAFIPYMIACPLFFCNKDIKRKIWWTRRMWILGLLIVATITVVVDKITYNSEEWKSFYTYNDDRAYVADNPSSEDYSLKISDNKEKLAFELFCKYRIFDTNILTPAKLHKYKVDLCNMKWKTIRTNIKPYIYNYLYIGGWVLLVVFSWMATNFRRQKSKMAIILILMTLGLFALANIQMMSYSFAKERVLLFSLASLLYAICYIIKYTLQKNDVLLLSVSLMLTILFAHKGIRAFNETQADHSLISETESIIKSDKHEKILITVPVCLTPEAFHTSNSPIWTKSIVQGWMHCYPKVESKYRNFTALTNGLPLLIEKSSREQVSYIRKLIELQYRQYTKENILIESEHYILISLKKNK